jgi:hypothetical protein
MRIGSLLLAAAAAAGAVVAPAAAGAAGFAVGAGWAAGAHATTRSDSVAPTQRKRIKRPAAIMASSRVCPDPFAREIVPFTERVLAVTVVAPEKDRQ